MKYVSNLHIVDDRVLSVSPKICKQHHIYICIIILCNSRKYFIQLSHPFEKHKEMSPRADFDKVYDKYNSSFQITK